MEQSVYAVSDTPRTDEEVEIAKKFPATQHGLWVSAEFARQLERDLNKREKQLLEVQHQLIQRNAELADAIWWRDDAWRQLNAAPQVPPRGGTHSAEDLASAVAAPLICEHGISRWHWCSACSHTWCSRCNGLAPSDMGCKADDCWVKEHMSEEQ